LSVSLPDIIASGERAPGTHWIGDWDGLREGLDTVEKRKSFASAGNGNPAVQPVARSYTDYTTLKNKTRVAI
jgi:hypothetical protein